MTTSVLDPEPPTTPNPDLAPLSTTTQTSMLQLINYEEHFNPDLPAFLSTHNLSTLGFDYNIAAIMGPQSSGKSTLLNLLFDTKFRTMDEATGRYQVTQGVWLGHDSHRRIIVMDLEGTDSRERGEDAATYERKSSLFALALAEVLIVNVWAQDVGRYNAANMSLLKTVMELDLQLFFGGAAAKPNPVLESDASHSAPQPTTHSVPRMHKTRLLFVLRDHVSSPFETLCNTLRADVDKIWDTINKPEAAKGTSVTDYFDLDFFALPHKVLMEKEFYAKGKELKRRFHEKEVFLDEYSRGVAADGFAAYANNVWETIRANRELDIPTQKEMLAHVRCEQIAREAIAVVDESLAPLRTKLIPPVGDGEIVDALYSTLVDMCERAVEIYDSKAFRYSTAVAQMKGTDLKTKIGADCKMLLDIQIALASDLAVAEFRRKTGAGNTASMSSEPWKDWGSVWKTALEESLRIFDEACGSDTVKENAAATGDGHPLAFVEGTCANARKRVVAALENEVERATGEVNSAARSHCEKTFREAFKGPLGSVLENAGSDVWERASEVGEVAWEATAREAKAVYGSEGLGLEDEKVEDAVEDDIKPICFERAVGDIKDAVGTPNNFLLRMTKRFDDAFRFDERGVPRHFGPNEDIEALFVAAREKGEELVELLAEIHLKGSLTNLRSSARSVDKDISQPVIIPVHSRDDLREKLKRQAGAVFMEAKRAQEAAKITSKIPIWMIGLLVILGWNELMVILRNPILLLLTVVVVPMVYFGYTMDAQGLLGPAVRTTMMPILQQVKGIVDQAMEGAGGSGGGTVDSETVVSGNGRADSSASLNNIKRD